MKEGSTPGPEELLRGDRNQPEIDVIGWRSDGSGAIGADAGNL
jgi:hypothetical protein